MTGSWQLDPPPRATDGDGSTVQRMDDGSVVTSFADGTSRTDYPDGSVTITYADSSVLNIYPDGSRTLTDAGGASRDPYSGALRIDITVPQMRFRRDPGAADD